jgi:hypothetical protein
VIGADMNFKAWGRPFKFVSEAYYKQLENIIPYEIDNVRIRYFAENTASGSVKGVDFRVNGEFVKGTESWASLSFMDAKEITYQPKGCGRETQKRQGISQDLPISLCRLPLPFKIT